MLFSIGNAITLVVVLAFFFIYHKLTANNRSLEKVRKFADKLQGELSAYVETRSEELKHFGIDLEVQQKAARIALDKLQAAQSTIAEKSEAIGAIADRFKEYDSVLAKLMDMTAKVDKNLAQIHEDEIFAEGVNRKLELAKKGLAAMERELPLLRESFEQSAQKTVEAFKEDILDELQEGLASTAAELKAGRDEAQSALEQAKAAGDTIRERLDETLERAAMRAGDMEDKAFEELVRHLEEKRRDFAAALEAKLAALGKEAETMTGDLRKAMEGLRQSWREESQAMMKDMASKLQELESIFAAKAAEIADLLENSFDKAKATEYSLSSMADTSKRELAESLGKMEALEAGLNETLEATKNRIQDEFASFGQAFEAHRTSFEENIAEETKNLEARLGSLREKVEELETESFKKLDSGLDQFGEGLISSLVAKKVESFKKLDSWLSELQASLSGITEQAKARRLEEEAANQKEFKSQLAKAREEMYVQLAKLASDIDALQEGLGAKSPRSEGAQPS